MDIQSIATMMPTASRITLFMPLIVVVFMMVKVWEQTPGTFILYPERFISFTVQRYMLRGRLETESGNGGYRNGTMRFCN
jgi:hypothetical protein